MRWRIEDVAENLSPQSGLAIAIVAVSTSAIFVRWSDAPSVVIAFYRVLFTIAMLAPFALTRHRHSYRRLSLRDGAIALITGIALAIHFAAWFESLNWTSVAAAVTLTQTQPIFVVIVAYAVLKERVTSRMVFGILLAVLGAATMSVGDIALGADVVGSALYGNGLAIVGAVMAAAYVIAGRSLRQRVALLPYVTVVYVACAATLFVVSIANGYELLAYPLREWILFAGLALGPGVFGHTLINWALAHIESSVVSVSLLGEPVGATILALFLLAEVPDVMTILGGSIVLFGIFLTARARQL